MVHTHCTGLGTGTGQGTGPGTMDFYIILCTVHIKLKLGTSQEPIFSYCASPIPCSGPGPVQCD